MTALARALGASRPSSPTGSTSSAAAPGGSRSSAPIAAGLEAAVKGIIARPELQLTPDVPGEREIRELIESAW